MSQSQRRMFGPLLPSILIVVLTIGGLLGVSSAWRMVSDWLETRSRIQTFRGSDSSSRENAARLLAQRGSAVAVPIFLEATHDKRGEIRILAYRYLAEMAMEPSMVVPALIAAAGDDPADIRAEAARGFGLIQTRWSSRLKTNSADGARASCLEALHRLIADPSSLVRVAAVAALGAFGPDPAATADLVQAASDADRAVRFAAAQALLKVNGAGDRSASRVLVALVSDPEPIPDRREVMDILLNTTDELLEQAVAALARLLSNRESLVRPDVIDCLSAAGARAHAAVPALESLWIDKHCDLRASAGMAIVAIEGPESPQSLEDMSAAGMMGGMAAAGMMGGMMGGQVAGTARQPSPRSVEILVSIVSDPTLLHSERQAAIPWLRATNPQTLAKATPDLIRQLTHQNAQVRQDAAALLASIIDLTPAEIPPVESKERH